MIGLTELFIGSDLFIGYLVFYWVFGVVYWVFEGEFQFNRNESSKEPEFRTLENVKLLKFEKNRYKI